VNDKRAALADFARPESSINLIHTSARTTAPRFNDECARINPDRDGTVNFPTRRKRGGVYCSRSLAEEARILYRERANNSRRRMRRGSPLLLPFFSLQLFLIRASSLHALWLHSVRLDAICSDRTAKLPWPPAKFNLHENRSVPTFTDAWGIKGILGMPVARGRDATRRDERGGWEGDGGRGGAGERRGQK